MNMNRTSLRAGDGRLTPAKALLALGRRPWHAALVDMNADKKLDAVLAADGVVMLLLGDGRGGFEPAPGSPFAVGRGAWTLAVGDFDGDGDPDVAVDDHDVDTVTLL
jgi:hypothetical protein